MLEEDTVQPHAQVRRYTVVRGALRVEAQCQHFGVRFGRRFRLYELLLGKQVQEVLRGGTLLVDPLLGKCFQAGRDLRWRIPAMLGIGAQRRQHRHDAAAFLALATGTDPLAVDVRGVAGDLQSQEFRVTLRQYFLDQKLGERTQNGKLHDVPLLALVVAGHCFVEPAALIIDSCIVGDAAVALPRRRIELVAEDDAADAATVDEGQCAENEHRDRPQPDRVDVGAHACMVFPDERQVRQHPDEQAIRIRPDARGTRNVFLEVAPRIQRREPVAARLVDEYRVYLGADFVQQTITQQAVLAAAREHRGPVR